MCDCIGKITFNHDPVNRPDHYVIGGIDTYDFIKAKNLSYEEGNIVKYVVRSRHKGKPCEDLRKAEWYLCKIIKTATGQRLEDLMEVSKLLEQLITEAEKLTKEAENE